MREGFNLSRPLAHTGFLFFWSASDREFSPEGRAVLQKNHLARNLRLLRAAHRLSQRELSNRVGLHQTYVSALERGLTPSSDAHIDRLASALNTSATELLASTFSVS